MALGLLRVVGTAGFWIGGLHSTVLRAAHFYMERSQKELWAFSMILEKKRENRSQTQERVHLWGPYCNYLSFYLATFLLTLHFLLWEVQMWHRDSGPILSNPHLICTTGAPEKDQQGADLCLNEAGFNCCLECWQSLAPCVESAPRWTPH